jgi:hypothetical protein
MYSASVVDAATVGCLLLDQLTAPPAMVNTYPVIIIIIILQPVPPMVSPP